MFENLETKAKSTTFLKNAKSRNLAPHCALLFVGFTYGKLVFYPVTRDILVQPINVAVTSLTPSRVWKRLGVANQRSSINSVLISHMEMRSAARVTRGPSRELLTAFMRFIQSR